MSFLSLCIYDSHFDKPIAILCGHAATHSHWLGPSSPSRTGSPCKVPASCIVYSSFVVLSAMRPPPLPSVAHVRFLLSSMVPFTVMHLRRQRRRMHKQQNKPSLDRVSATSFHKRDTWTYVCTYGLTRLVRESQNNMLSHPEYSHQWQQSGLCDISNRSTKTHYVKGALL